MAAFPGSDVMSGRFLRQASRATSFSTDFSPFAAAGSPFAAAVAGDPASGRVLAGAAAGAAATLGAGGSLGVGGSLGAGGSLGDRSSLTGFAVATAASEAASA